MITYVFYVDATTGEILIAKIAKGVNPPEGIDEDTGYRVVHYTGGISDIGDFVDTRYWTSTGFQTYPTKPNDHATWNGTAWTFDFADILADVRRVRDETLAYSDFTQLSDAPYTDAQKTQFATWRQQLRDLPGTVPNTVTNINQVAFPTPPTT